jgi:hypothetical protein
MFTIAAPYDTCVDVQFYNGPLHYRQMFITLPPGTTYNVATTGDCTGLSVTSTQPIAVYSGLDCAYVPYDVSAVKSCDHIVEQVPPTSQYGTQFIVTNPQGRNLLVGFQYRVVATTTTLVSVTTLTYTGGQASAPVVSPAVTIQQGNYYEGTAGRGSASQVVVLITCNQSCLVMQYNTAYDMTIVAGGTEPGNNKPDEFMVTVPGLNHYPSSVTF